MLEVHVFLLLLMYMFRGRSLESVIVYWTLWYMASQDVCVCVCMSDYSETWVITVLWEWQQEKDTVCFEGDLLMICPFLILPLSWPLSKCVFTLAFILFDVMLVLLLWLHVLWILLEDLLISLFCCPHATRIRHQVAEQNNRVINFILLVSIALIALQIIPVTFIMYLPFIFVFFSPKLFIATIYVV